MLHMLEILKYYWFASKVFFNLSWLLFLTGLNRIKKYRAFLFLVVVSINILTLSWFKTLAQEQVSLVVPPPPPPYAEITTEVNLTPNQVLDKIEQLEKVLVKQPTHVDILINLGLLYDSINEPLAAADYWRQAQIINPYHPFFSVQE
jgi:hypothetical protein